MALYMYTFSQKNNTDVAHYKLNAHQPILLIFGTYIAELFAIPPLLTNVLHYLGKHEPWKLGLFTHAIYCVCFGLLYLRHLSTNFDNFFL